MLIEGCLSAAAHTAVLAALHAACFPPGECWDAPAMADLLAMSGCFAVLAPDAAPSGLALGRLAGDEAELLTLGVLPAARGRGLAVALLDAVLRRAADGGAARLFLEVAEANAAARALYCRRGFAVVGRRPDYYPDGGDALLMARDLAVRPCGSKPA